MDKVQLLERHFNAFINLENVRDFFIGMTDYLEFADAVPEFEHITADIFAQKKPLEEKLEAFKKKALEKVLVAYKEIDDYVSKNGISNAEVQEELKECKGWVEGKIVGSNSQPVGLYIVLGDVIASLHRIPEHKVFTSQYIQLYKNRPDLINHYIYVKEVQDLMDLSEEIKRRKETELWGQLEEISWRYSTIKNGRELHKSLVEEHKNTRSSQAAFNIINHSVLIGEWVMIEENRHNQRDNYFFKIAKVRPWLVRLHNQIVSRFLLGTQKHPLGSLTTTENKQIPTSFSPRLSTSGRILQLQIFKQTKKHTIGGIETRKSKLIRCLFSPENTIEATYNSVFQQYERVFEAIKLPKDARNGKLKSSATDKREMVSIVENCVAEIQKLKSLHGYLNFERNDNKIRLEISMSEGNNYGS